MFTWIGINELSVRFDFPKFFKHYFVFWTTVNWLAVEAVEAIGPAGCRLHYLDDHGN